MRQQCKGEFPKIAHEYEIYRKHDDAVVEFFVHVTTIAGWGLHLRWRFGQGVRCWG